VISNTDKANAEAFVRGETAREIDRERYELLVDELGVLTKRIESIWSEIEQIKNRYGGHTP
jgi:hypothetical protein